MSKVISQDKVTEKFAHFTDVHFKESVCVNMDSFERCIYVLGRKFRIDRYVCAAITENGEVIPLSPDNLTIATKPKYSNDFVGYAKIGEVCIKMSHKSPYSLKYSFVFAFICDNVVVSILLTRPIAPNTYLSGMSVDIGLKNNESNYGYNKVMESISSIFSLIKSTVLKNVKSDTAFTGIFEHQNSLLLTDKSTDEIVQSEQPERDVQYD